MGWLLAVARCGPPSCSPGCGVVVIVQSGALGVSGLNQGAAFDPASNGVLRSQEQLLGWDGGNFQVWQ